MSVRLRELLHFLMHLRLHYQFFILSGGFLLGGFFVDQIDWEVYLSQFLNIHILLFGGATAYNSYWDKDDGPIGGLKNPPKMKRWMWALSLIMQFIGVVFAYKLGLTYILIYLLSLLLFWLYSTPHARWKGHPILSLMAIGVSTGTNSFLLGFIAAGGEILLPLTIFTSLGVCLVLLSLYPVSQVFQIEEDTKRGDRTFASVYGLDGIRNFFMISFLAGSAMITYSILRYHFYPGIIFGILSLVSFIIILSIMKTLKGHEDEYPVVMRIKFLASFGFVFFIISAIVFKNELFGIQIAEWVF